MKADKQLDKSILTSWVLALSFRSLAVSSAVLKLTLSLDPKMSPGRRSLLQHDTTLSSSSSSSDVKAT